MGAFHDRTAMPWIKRTALALGVLVLLLAAAAAVFVASFDAERYKPMAVDWMKARYQRTLAIDGPIELGLFPRLAIKVSKLRLSEPGRAETFASIDEASLSLALWPLLRKEIVVDRVRARGLQAVLTRDASGRRNIDDLLSSDGRAPSAPRDPTGGASAMPFDVGGVSLENARLTLRDAQAGRAGTLVLASLTSGRLAPGIETPLSLQAQLDLTQPQALKLAIDGKTMLAFDAAAGAAALRDATLRVSGDTAALKALAMTLQAKRLAFDPAAQKIEVDALKLGLAGRLGKDPLELALDWPRMAVAGDTLSGSPFNGRLKLEGATALSARFESGAPAGGFDALRLPGFALVFDGQQGARKLKGELKSNLLLEPAKATARLDRLALRADIAEPGLAPLKLALDGQASAGANAAQWALQGGLNQNRFESQGRAAFGAGVPNVQASARFDRLDLNQLLAPRQATSAPAAAAAPADTPVDLGGLKALNGRFEFAAGQFALRQYKVSDARIDATLDAGTLRIARLTGGAWGGRIDASGSAQAAAPQRIAIKLAASGVDVHALLKDVAGKDLIEGRGRVSADLTTQGGTVAALRSRLAGDAALQLRDGAVKGINLARSLRQARAALAGRQDALAKAQASEKTDFSELTATARIADGIAVSDDLDVKSPFLRIGGGGRFDIGRGRVDYTARVTVVGAPAGQDGAELAALKGVTVPVQLEGPFDAIDWRIRWSGVAAAAVESRLKDKLAEKLGAKLGGPAPNAASAPTSPKDAARDKLKEKLKGLLGK
jgi:AsmA protein